MDKIKVGIPRALYYYHYGDMLKSFFKYLDLEFVISPKSNKEIYKIGLDNSQDEMCSALKMYFGHVYYLKDRVDYIIIPRIDNYGIDNQMCTNFMAIYDIVKNKFNINILNFNIDYVKNEKEYDGLMKIGRELGFDKKLIKTAYIKTKKYLKLLNKQRINENYHKLLSKKKKILLIGHPYVLYDNLLGEQIIHLLKKQNIETIMCDKFNKELANDESKKISKTNYFKYSKEILGSISLVNKYIDGVIFISSFPCALDSIANELAILKCNLPCINIVIDDLNSISGIETRIESFCDLIERKKIC